MSKKRTREEEEKEVEGERIDEGNCVGNEEDGRRKKSPKLSSEQSDDKHEGEEKQGAAAVANAEEQRGEEEEAKKDEEEIAKEEEPAKKEEEKKGEAEVAIEEKEEVATEKKEKEEADKENKTKEEQEKKENNGTGKEDKEDKKEEKPRKSTSGGGHVFGSGSSFGSAFGSIPQKNVFASDDKENKQDPGTKKPVFGSGFAFGSSSFANEKKENIFDSAPQENAKKEEEDANEDTPEASKETYAKVEQPLTEKKIETGEEGEQSVFSCRAKLYTLDLTNPSEGWRERGVGTLHVNTTQESKSRLVMRADGVLKVILNLPLLSGFEVHSGMNSSLSGEKFVRINCIQENKPLQYALRTSNADISKQLFDEIEKLIPAE